MTEVARSMIGMADFVAMRWIVIAELIIGLA